MENKVKKLTELERELMQAQLEQLTGEQSEEKKEWETNLLTAIQGIQETMETMNTNIESQIRQIEAVATAIDNLQPKIEAIASAINNLQPSQQSNS